MNHVITTPLPNIFENQWSKPDEFDEVLERLKKFTLAVCLNKDTLISFYSVMLQMAPKMWTKNGIIGKVQDTFKNGTEYYNQPAQDAIASFLAALQRGFDSREGSPSEGVIIGRKRKSSPPQNQIVKEQRTENGRHEAGTLISMRNVAPNVARNNHFNRILPNVAASLVPKVGLNLLPIISDDAAAQRNDDLRQMHLILDDRYLFLSGIEGTFFYACFDLRTKMELICRPNENTTILDRASVMEGHQHINQIVTVVHKPSRVYVFYKQLKNDLLSYIRQKHKIHEVEAKDIFRQIVQIVIDCHAKGIVLRDLKMKKFYFDNNDPKRIKFESLEDAILLENKDDDKLLHRRGCIVYIAPEILQVNQKYKGKPADIWSLGVVLYTLVVGRYPFNDIDHRQLVTKIAAANYTIPSFVSSRCADLIRSMLAYDPKDRISAEHILNHDWFKTEDEMFTPSVDDQLVPDSNPALSPVHGDHF